MTKQKKTRTGRPDAIILDTYDKFRSGKATGADMVAAIQLALESTDWTGYPKEHLWAQTYARQSAQVWEELRAATAKAEGR